MPKHNQSPLVSIICISYNQDQYLAQTLDSFLMQKTNFSFEVIVHDDASVDNTRKILRGYVNKYPDIIKVIYAKSNRFSKKDYSFISELFKIAKGKYIAMCEGDDYWTDNNKLQLQVDYLEKYKSHAMCFHPISIKFENSKEDNLYPKKKYWKMMTLEDIIKENFIPTNSVMYRKQDYSDLSTTTLPSDWYLHAYHANFGSIGFINRNMAVYRRNDNGVWWDSINNQKRFWLTNHSSLIGLHEKFLTMFEGKENIEAIVKNNIYFVIQNALIHSNIEEKELIVNDYFRYITGFIEYHNSNYLKIIQKNKKYADTITILKESLRKRDKQIAYMHTEIDKLLDGNEELRQSMSWRVTKPLRVISAKINYNNIKRKYK